MNHRILALLVLLAVCSALGPAQTGLRITEILYDIPSSPNGDPNGDGTRQPAGDEFVEIYNGSNASVDLSAYQLIEREKQVVFTFPVISGMRRSGWASPFKSASATMRGPFPAAR